MFTSKPSFAKGTKELQNTRVTVIKNGSLAMFSDDLGRSINVDDDGFTKVIAGTPAAQNYIYAIDPSRLYGLSAAWPENAKRLVAKAEENLPVYGIFDYMADGFDWEKLKTSGADAVLIVGNIGSYKSEITSLLDEKQEEIGIPLIFINDQFPFTPTTINRIALIISSYQNRIDPNQLAEELMLPLKVGDEPSHHRRFSASVKTAEGNQKSGGFVFAHIKAFHLC